MLKKDICPCGTGQVYSVCCGLCLSGKSASTAEQLMRSRYTAYVLGDESYLLKTWHVKTRPQNLNFADKDPVKWIGLKVLSRVMSDVGSDEASVEFIARYKVNGKAEKLHELSSFIKEGGEWFYVKGDLRK